LVCSHFYPEQALACFTLRDIDFCKIESRPTSPQLFRFLQFQQRQKAISSANAGKEGNSMTTLNISCDFDDDGVMGVVVGVIQYYQSLRTLASLIFHVSATASILISWRHNWMSQLAMPFYNSKSNHNSFVSWALILPGMPRCCESAFLQKAFLSRHLIPVPLL